MAKQIRLKNRQVKRDTDSFEKASGSSAYANEYAVMFKRLKKLIGCWDSFFNEIVNPDRDQVWPQLDKEQSDLCHYFAWAVPDARALAVIAHFGPIIEIGSGMGFWAYLLRKKGVDILATDKFVTKKACWTKVEKSSVERLESEDAQGRTLLLCYPDEQESVASACLEAYTGEYIIHVGELMFTGTTCGEPIAPFGRTSSLDFQVLLQARFHCVFVAELLHRFPNSKDCISVWRRTDWIIRPEVDENGNEIVVEDDSNGAKRKKQKTQHANPTGAASNDHSNVALQESAVEYFSMSDLAKLRGEVSTTAAPTNVKTSTVVASKKATTNNNNNDDTDSNRESSDEEAGSDDDDDDSNNNSDSEDGSGSGSEEGSESDGDEEEEQTTLSVLREILLDCQYNESGASLWASIKPEFRLPVDRAAPQFVHLLEKPKK